MVTFALLPLLLLVVLVGGLLVATMVITLLAGHRVVGAGLFIIGLMFVIGLLSAGWFTARRHVSTVRVWPGADVRRLELEELEARARVAAIEEALERDRLRLDEGVRDQTLTPAAPSAEHVTLPSPLARSDYEAEHSPGSDVPHHAPPSTPVTPEPADASSDVNEAGGGAPSADDAADQPTAETSSDEALDADEANPGDGQTDHSDTSQAHTTDARVDQPQALAADDAGESVEDVVEQEPEPVEAEEKVEVGAETRAPGVEQESAPGAAETSSPVASATTAASAPSEKGWDLNSTPTPSRESGSDVDGLPPTSEFLSPIPANAPSWVHQPLTRLEGQLAMVLVSDPFEDQFSCNDDLERKTRNVIGQFAARRCRQLGLARLPVQITYDDIEMVLRERYYQPRSTSVGEMLVGYQLTVMDDAFQAKLDQRITDAMVQRRLTTAGVFSGGVLLGVTFLFGVFRFAARKSPDPLRIS